MYILFADDNTLTKSLHYGIVPLNFYLEKKDMDQQLMCGVVGELATFICNVEFFTLLKQVHFYPVPNMHFVQKKSKKKAIHFLQIFT